MQKQSKPPAPETKRKQQGRNGFALQMALFYGAMFLFVGIFLPFFPVWLKSRGLKPEDISLLLAGPLVVRVLFTPVVTYLADLSGNRRRVLIALAWGSLACGLAFIPLSGFWPLMLISVLFGMFWTSVMPLSEAIAMTQVKLQGLDYGRIRLWGSLTFIIASLGGGFIIDAFGDNSILYMMLAALLITTLAAYNLPRCKNGKARKTGELTELTELGETAQESSPPQAPIHWSEALRLLLSPLFILFLLTAAGIQATHAVYYGFGSLHWQHLGLTSGVIGALWAVGVIAEVTLFAWSTPIIKRVGATGLLIAASGGALLRWGMMALDPPLWLLFPLQTLHALTFGAAHLGAIHFIARAVPEKASATGQGLYSAFAMGIVMGAMTTLSGTLYESFAGKSYMVMAALSFASLLGALLLRHRWRSGEVIVIEKA